MTLIDPNKVQKTDNFKFLEPPTNPVQLAYDLIEVLKQHNAISVAANQVGLPYRVIAVVGEPCYVCFNPIIVDISEEQVKLEEIDILYKNVLLSIERPRIIKVRFTMPNGDTTTKKFDGLTARYFQHSIDWLDGINFLSKVNRYHREKALKKAAKLTKQNKVVQLRYGTKNNNV